MILTYQRTRMKKDEEICEHDRSDAKKWKKCGKVSWKRNYEASCFVKVARLRHDRFLAFSTANSFIASFCFSWFISDQGFCFAKKAVILSGDGPPVLPRLAEYAKPQKVQLGGSFGTQRPERWISIIESRVPSPRQLEISKFHLHVDISFRSEKEIDKIRPFVFLPRVGADSANPDILSKVRC